ncbi:hypothetical protein BFX06_12190 [Sulfobacillus thermosulfidooxidans]|nr:hypothetical protein BFX06_12190 [Sulfobacillus thermosulfidooxidans]
MRPLGFDVTFHRLQRGFTDAPNIICAMPEVWLPIEFRQMIGKSIAHPPRTGGLKIVNQGRQVQRRMDTHQQMDMICFPPELNQGTAPVVQDFCERLSQGREEF